MVTLKVKVILQWSGAEKELEAPGDISVGEFISELFSLFEFYKTGMDANPANYKLYSKELQKFLPEKKALAAAKVNSGHHLYLSCLIPIKKDGRISVKPASIGSSLENLAKLEVNDFLNNESATRMLLDSFKLLYAQWDQYRRELAATKKKNDELNERFTEKTVGAMLFVFGQVQIGVGTELAFGPTDKNLGWIFLTSGALFSIIAILLSLIGLRKYKRH